MKYLSVLLLMLISISTYGQATKQMASFYDYKHTQPKEVFSVLVSNPTILQGPYKEYATNRVVISEGVYLKGEKFGKWIYRSEATGIINRIESYDAKGLYDGAYLFVSEINGIKEEGTYKSGKKIGQWKETYTNGKPKSIYYYVNGVKSGASQTYYKSGFVSSEGSYLNGKKNGSWKYYYADFPGKLTSLCKYSLDSFGTLIRNNVGYNSVGTKTSEGSLIELGDDSDNIYVGTYTEWDDSSKLKATTLVYGKDSITIDNYYPSGKVFQHYRKIRSYDNTKYLLTGPFREYYESGRLKSTGVFNNGYLPNKETFEDK